MQIEEGLPVSERLTPLDKDFSNKGGIERFINKKGFLKLDKRHEEFIANHNEWSQIVTSGHRKEGDDCKFQLPTEAELNNLESRPLKCSICEYCVADENALVQHSKEVHVPKKSFKCSDCEYCATTSSDLLGHFKRVHCESALIVIFVLFPRAVYCSMSKEFI